MKEDEDEEEEKEKKKKKDDEEHEEHDSIIYLGFLTLFDTNRIYEFMIYLTASSSRHLQRCHEFPRTSNPLAQIRCDVLVEEILGDVIAIIC